jgi:acyl transferase domain-containing protein/acyl carrier protein
MPTPPNSERDHQRIGETILLCNRKLLAQSGETGITRVLILGSLHEIAEREVTEVLKAQGDRVQYFRAFRSEGDLRLWESRFGPGFPKVQPRLLRLEQDVLAQGFSIGQFDLMAVIEAPDPQESGVGLLTNLKRLLKRKGLLLLEIRIKSAGDWKKALGRAGFEGAMARSDRVTDQAAASDLLIARSDGCVQIVSATSAELPPPGERFPNGSTSAGNGPLQAQSAVQPDRLRVESVRSPGSSLSREAVRERVLTLLERMLQIPRNDIDTSSPFIEFGVDSIVGVRFVNELNQQLHIELKATVLFDYGSVEKLATFIAEECQPPLGEITPGATSLLPLVTDFSGRDERTSRSSPVSSPSHESASSAPSFLFGPQVRESDVAIIGMSGRFPDADNVEAFWRNLAAGKNCIREVPPERWDQALVYDPGSRQANKTNSKWGGFLTDADKFDPLFFNISGREAEVTDPQHRLFLEECYHAIEDAGYAGFSANRAKKCGVFAGVEPGDYLHLLTNLPEQGENSPVFQGNAESILAARISYFLDLKGPSIAINTACSSSLVAIHLACQSLLNGECDLALAGGVRVFSSEQAYLALGNMGMLSPEGQCKTFDEGANGFVPGEAVGVLVLKPLAAAMRDGDHLYGLIKGSAINQDGRTNGITAPSSLSQAQVELEVYDKFGLRPETFQYVEAHGTGTKLGDPIEIEALTESFRRYTTANGFCAIGSVKTNIGHTMAAAGVCSIIKVLLALQHRVIPPSLNLQKTNPYIDFENSPFFVNTALRDWPAIPDRPRRAAISSFGFSGTNSHLVIEEAPERSAGLRSGASADLSGKPAYLIALSAKTPEALQQSLRGLIDWLRGKGDSAELEAISFTLNVGRGHFEHRCAIVAGSIGELTETLLRLVNGERTPSAWRSDGRKSDSGEAAIFRQVTAVVLKELPAALRQGEAVYREKLAALAALYARNYDLEFIALHHGEAHRRISLPTYPYARERYWVPALPAGDQRKQGRGTPQLHPLVHRNVSTLARTEFVSIFDGEEFFFDHHQIRGEKILPGVAYLEMATAAIRMVMEGAPFGLANIAWMRPLPGDQAQKVTIRLNRDGEDTRFEILSGDDKILHAQGKAVRNRTLEARRLDLAAIRARCPETESPEAIYGRCAEAGLKLGAGFRTIRSVCFGEGEALARLELPAALSPAAQEFVLHPGLMDGALQATAVLGRGKVAGLPVPFAVAEVLFHGVGSNCYAHVRRGSEEHGLLRFDVSLLEDSGDVLAELKGLTMRLLNPNAATVEQELIFVRPTWKEKPLSLASADQLAGRLLLFDPEEFLANEIGRLSPGLNILRVIPAPNYSVQGNVIGVRPDCSEDFDQLLQLGRPDFVIHRWNALTNETVVPIERSILPLFELTRALMRNGAHAPTDLLLLHSLGADPAYPAVAGYARTLRQERPNLRLKVLESDRIETSALIAELLDSSRDQEIRDRDGRREIKSLEIFAPERTQSIPLRERGVYLIVGGLGGLGRIFARYLAKQCHARLVLLGRSKMEPWPVLTELETLGAEVLYLRADVSRSEEVVAAMREVRSRFGDLNGVIHAAGVIRDGFVLNKSADDFSAVMASKVGGTVSLDEATRTDGLDFFVLFSSMAGVFGNVGQSDYAYANCFLDEFARLREQRRARGERSGRTVSVNWPLWRNGGMRQTADFERRKLTEFGLAALEDDVGLAIFEMALQCSEAQLMGLFGQPDKVRSLIASTEEQSGAPPMAPGPRRDFADFRQSALSYLTRQFSRLIKIPAARIGPDDPLEKYGIDSIMVMEFTQRLEKDFGELSKTLLFEHQTLAELVDYFLANHRDRLGELLDLPSSETIAAAQPIAAAPSTSVEESLSARPILRPERTDDIAIIGLSGRYPMADDLEQFWENLRTGKDCIVEIPKERWDYRLFYDPEQGKPGKTPNKWGGFLNDVERFDAQFFNITPREAFALDPQERLFLETVWRTIEDAGYRKSVLANRKIGVFVGVMYGEYQLYGTGDLAEGEVFPLSSSYASIANRVSYIFNWHGPSMAVDTMCSSSLTAIHLACESLRRGESELAIGGGVNATLHPHKDLLLSPGGFAASDGRCRSFGEGGDGYVPGEGVGAVLLKPLARAVADGDHVYAVVRASTVNHGGKTNGYTVPNPKAQAELISEALLQGNVAPRTVNYIEAHGTGTALGDPIEIAGLSKAFCEAGAVIDHHSIAVGSVKSNIGHLESAAGIAGVTKILLQMRHGQIAPSLHSVKLNPNINFANSAFYVPQALQEWKPAEVDRGAPIRRAGISSFGAGGANAHLILEEFVGDQPDVPLDGPANGPLLFILSAKTEDRLRARAEQLLQYLQRPGLVLAALPDIAYTLQIGREPLEERLAFVANDALEAGLRLRQFLTGEMAAELQRGSVRANGSETEQLLEGEEGHAFLDALIRQRKWQKLAQFWVSGGQVEWEKLHHDQRRVPLPTYPFAGVRYWAPDKLPITPKKQETENRLHPLIDRNVSDFEGQTFLTRVDPRDLTAPSGTGQKLLPGLWLLEMGAVAARLSSKSPLSRVVNAQWSAPQVVTDSLTLLTKVFAEEETIRFEIRTNEAEGVILAQASLLPGSLYVPGKANLNDILRRCTQAVNSDELLRQLAQIGIHSANGASVFPELWRGDGELFIRFRRSELDNRRFGDCDLHPFLLEAAMEAARDLVHAGTATRLVPVSLGSGLVQKMPADGWCHVTVRGDTADGKLVGISFLALDGAIVAVLNDLTVRSFQPEASPEALFLRPVWKERAAPVPDPGSLRGRLLLFDPDTALARDIEARHPSMSVTRVVPGDRFAHESGFIQINPQADGDYARLLEIASPDFILYRWVSVALPLEEGPSLDRNSELGTPNLVHRQLETALELGIFSLFRLTRKLVQRNLQSEVRLLFCHPLTAEPAFLAIGAFAKALAQEQPKLQLRVLQTKETDAGLLTEFFSGHDEREILRQHGERQIRTFEPIAPKADGQLPLREGGVYLLTGGLGGLGRLLANYLAGQYGARLVLTGRSALTEEARAKIAGMEEKGGQVLYLSGDVSRIEDAREIVHSAHQRFGALNGVIHTAGILRDSFLFKKEFGDFVDVLRPKVHGVSALDEATDDEPLDFFALFSSTAGAFGNAGQSDYAYANGFLDAFASAREVRRSAGERHGRTLSINWPWWKDGGMSIAARDIEARLAQFGLHPLSSTTGIALFETALRQEEPQLVALWGIRSKLTQTFLDTPDTGIESEPGTTGLMDESALSEKLEAYLKETLAEVTQLPVAQIDSDERFEEFGIDSIVVTDFNSRLEKGLGPLPKTLLFEYPNFRELTRHLVAAFKPQLARFLGNGSSPKSAGLESATIQSGWNVLKPLAPVNPGGPGLRTGEDIAIIGLAGRYPRASDLRAFWEILKSGTDCVTEIPKDRWDIDRYYDPDPNKAAEGKMYARWGAFVDEVDKFDPLFFSIAPVEAELMDPQERLFLETAWTTLEDAGYTRSDLARWVRKEYATNVGVFVGVTTNTYSFVARDNSGERVMPTTLPWSLANRVSYLFNFNGPSIPVDTACSSSLTAIHLACEAIRAGQCQQAIAGGVNLYLHPSKYVDLCLTRMLSTEGKCRAFGEGGDGFVPGEGVGAILLKPISLALADGDHVYGLIKGTAVNHGGRTNGYTVPNPAAQADLIIQALRRSAIDPVTLSYLEAHGTGTALGDPIEIAGLAKAFAATGTETMAEGICSVGSVKTNIGHLEAAAGIAGLTKVLLQMKHRQLVPSLHADRLNLSITFAGTPFRLQRSLEEWRIAESDSRPRRAGISSFGAGGANAFVVVEEFISRPTQANRKPLSDSPALIVLSARNGDRLQTVAKNLAEFLARSTDAETPLPSIAYTLQIGREALEERMAFVARSRGDLLSKLERIGHGDLEGLNRGHVKRERVPVAAEADGPKADSTVVEALSHRDLERLARLWVDGVPVNWRDLSTGQDPGQRVSLPGYPFNRERYWVPLFASSDQAKELTATRLHPLLHRNESTLDVQKYETHFDGGEVVLRDHQVNGRKVLPGAASLELALAGVSRALGNPDIQLRQVVWMRPLAAGTDGLKIELSLRLESDGRVSFELKGPSGDTHVQGKAEVTAGLSKETVDLKAIRDRCLGTLAPDTLYPAFADRGLGYGVGFRTLQEIRYSDREVLSVVQVPQEWGADQYRLHPALVDGALQSLAVIGAGSDGVELPFAVDEVRCGESLPSRCYAYGRVESEKDGLRRYELKLLNDHGQVLAQLSGLSVRTHERSQGELLYYGPVWHLEPIKIESAVEGPILLLDEGRGLAEALERQGVSAVRVLAGDAYRRNGNVITIRPKQAEDYERLAQEVTFSAVIHRWSRQGSRLEEALECGLYSVHRLARALIKSAKAVPWVYAYPRDEAAYEAVGGYAKTLRQEQPKLRLKTVGVDHTPADLVSELSDGQFEVRYREGQREVRALEKLPAPTRDGESPCRRQGVYLLSGGAGGLGTIFANHLVQRYDARLLLIGRSELSELRRHELEKLGDQVLYLQADVSRLEGATQAVHVAKQRYGGLNGVIHAAGELRDGLIRNKSLADIEKVLAAKVWGVQYLDAATRDEPLDFFILFSSLAGLLGNVGQSDYAYANAFLDCFAHRREELRRTGQRSGRTLSLNWPLWREGGMQAGDGTVRFQLQELDLRPLETKEGLAAFTQVISAGQDQCAVFCGVPQKLLAHLKKRPADLHEGGQAIPDAGSKERKTLLFGDVRRLVAKVLRLDVEVIEPDADTSEYGFDSITFTALANELNASFGFEVTPALLFEYRTLEAFVDFLCREHGDKLAARYTPKEDSSSSRSMVFQRQGPPSPLTTGHPEVAGPSRVIENTRSDPIAIVGMSGVFPGSPDLDTFWRNLDEGKDLIARAPSERWYFASASPMPGSTAAQMESPWGGFIPDPDKFDPLFFDISPREAELMDPQQRLFLQTVWHTLEDAGYKKSDLAGTKTGLFAGVAANDYANLLATHGVAVEAYSSTGNAHSVLANRVSYFFDLHGPSEAIDTACSSSLVAIHRAIESIASGSSEMAIVGGVNVLLSPGAFLAFGKAGMLCQDGRCKTFDVRANGYVRGEGVGAILLKPLSRARRDGDHIYAVVIGSGENHGGRVQSLTVPNPNAQAQLLQDIYARAGIDPFTISYIEAHGTGTSLGDPIEINGLKKAFGQNPGQVPEPRCAVGSVKTNIGHLETAAGIAGVIKALLAIHHRRIPGNVHLQEINPYIQVEGTPFCFPKRSVPWEPLRDREGRAVPRRAGVSSFGFGGANAHVLLEEYSEPVDILEAQNHLAGPELFLFSARDPARLKEVITHFLTYLRRLTEHPIEPLSPDLRRIAYTLQVGREPMDERLAVIASTAAELAGELAKYLQDQRSDLLSGNVGDHRAGLRLLRQVHEGDDFLAPFLEGRQLAKLARLWVSGLEVPWDELWAGSQVRRASLPGYPFDRQRYWIPAGAKQEEPKLAAEVRLHPLLHSNESTLMVQRYGSQFSGDETVFRDHQVGGEKVFPGAAGLELALAGVSRALENPNVRLCQVVWARPLVAGSEGVPLKFELRPESDGRVSFELQSPNGETHLQGKAEFTAGPLGEPLNLQAIRARCQQTISSRDLYTGFAERGLEYGPGFRVIMEIGYGSGEVFSALEIPSGWGEANYRLHPALVDGALQSLAMVGEGRGGGLELPFAVNEVDCREALPKRCYAYGRIESDRGGVRRYEVKLLGEHGEVLAHLGGLAMRRFERGVRELLYYRPIWIPDALPHSDVPLPAGTVLLLDETPELQETLTARGISTMRVIPGPVYEQNGSLIRIRQESAEDYARLVREIEFAGVIHRWSRPGVTLDEALERGLYSVLKLTQALLKGGKARPFVYAYPAGEIAYEAVAGYAKSLRQEQPNFRLKTVGVESQMTDLLQELNNDRLEVCYRAGRREARTLEELPGQPVTETPLKQGGVYVVSGGAGGLGRIFAEYLVRKYDARLVLAGRSELTEIRRQELALLGDHAIYVRADISATEGAEYVIGQAKQRYGALNGVIHAAAELRDGLIWNKIGADFAAVLAAKVRGLEALDAATSQDPLDCFVLFSSIAALFGSAGQSDYAYANAYLDAFAHRREELRRGGQRSGRTLSLNWPLWRDGGLKGKLGSGRTEALGLVPLERDQGLQIFETALTSGETQIWGCVGSRDRIRALVLESSPRMTEKRSALPAASSNADANAGSQNSELELTHYLIHQFAALTKMEPRQIRSSEPLEKYGFDSIMAVEFSQQLEQDFGDLSKTLLFEYPTLEALAGYFRENHGARLAVLWQQRLPESSPASSARGKAGRLTYSITSQMDQEVKRSEAKNSARFLPPFEPGSSNEDVAVIGVFGRYPQADNLDEFWANLVEGRDCIEEIPFGRWDYRLYFDPEPGTQGRSYNKWGGFLREVDKFDPIFFNISPREAEMIDPQERLFLETVWNTVEDAGYSRHALSGRKIGVFAGVMYGQYQLFGVEESLRRGEVTTLSSSYASIANRVSYFFDWRGPSVAVDTMCSSALMSVHLACESLKRGESQMAIAGGVNLILHPHKDVGLSQAGFLNKEGRCRSFGKTDGRGYVPGEGVGSVLLKPLSTAIQERDHIYGVIKATVVNHNGKTNGYTTPNPNALAELIAEGFKKAGIDPRTIRYVEAAATGSALGDPLEISGLTKAFQQATQDLQFCAIGSVKSNGGHLESASGIAGLTKALLQLKHRKLVPSVHTEELNPDIRWEKTPFFVQRQLADWQPTVVDGSTHLRRAGVNAFGAGGSNAHLIVEEYPEVKDESNDAPLVQTPMLIVLSAKDHQRLVERAFDLVVYLRAGINGEALRPRLLDLAYTLQLGREPMEARLAFLADRLEVVIEKLTLFAAEATEIVGLYRGGNSEDEQTEPARRTNDMLEANPTEAIREGDLNRLAAWWVGGGEPDWEGLYTGLEPRRISLPTYRFARERCWFRDGASATKANVVLLDKNDLDQGRQIAGEDGLQNRLLTEVRQLLGTALKLSPARIGLRQRLVECGLDSVTTVAFLKELERRHDIQVSAARLIEYPTLESFVGFLLEHHLEALASDVRRSAFGVQRSAFANGGSPDREKMAGGLVDGKTALRMLALAPLDYLFVGPRRFAIQVLYYFEPHLDFSRLQAGLRSVGQAFYPINSHLVRHREEYFICECSDEPDFAEVLCDARAVLPEQDRPETFAPFQVLFDPLQPEEKLAKFRLFQLANGSLLSVNISHAIADGYSFYYFLSSWAAACRGESFSPPDHSRRLPNPLGRRSLVEQAKDSSNGLSEVHVSFPFLEAGIDPTTRRVETLRFDGASLLAEARDIADEMTRQKITENSLLTALVWQAYARALNTETRELVLACPIDFRRLSSELSPSFFGNASAPALLRLEREQVLTESVPRLAALISDTIRSCDERTLARYQVSIDELRRARGLDATARLVLVDPRNGLIVTNVARFPLPPIDFGAGPVKGEFTPINYAGTGVIVSDKGSSVKIRLSLPDLVRH